MCLPVLMLHLQNIGNVDVAVTMKTCILEMLGSNLGQDNGYPELSTSWISLIPPGKC
jgi:hypothetical protein